MYKRQTQTSPLNILEGGTFPAFPFSEQSQAWGATPKGPERNRLDLTLTNLDRVRVHVKRARLTCNPKINATSNGPAKVVLVGCRKSVAVD